MIELPPLTPAEVLWGAMVGVMRQAQNIKIKRKPAYGAGDDDDWTKHIEGALAEMTFAKYMGVYWTGAFCFRASDVGGWNVRCRSRHSYDLILHEEDPDDGKFVLLTGKNGIYRLHGGIVASEGKLNKYWSDPAGGRPAFFVPKSMLTPIE